MVGIIYGRSTIIAMVALILAGELIFSLPFHIPRFFRPTMLDAMNITNTQLGDAFAIYGICAMLAYFPGGALADRFSPRKLLTVSLLATALGGVYLSTLPDSFGMKVLFAYWGITTIFLFWGAMIKATSIIGADTYQGRAFGFLDGGRGFVASAASTIAIILLSISMPILLTDDSDSDAAHNFRLLSYFYTVLTLGAAGCIWFSLRNEENTPNTQLSLRDIAPCLALPSVWCIAIIVMCAYCGYKSLDYISLYAVDVLNMPREDAERYASTLSYLRPVAAISAGFLADWLRSNRVIITGFTILFLASLLLGFNSLSVDGNMHFFSLISINIIVSFWAVYAIRGIYFASVHDANIQTKMMGTAVGIVSAVGFMPDIFFAPLTGRILDGNPGLIGYQYVYFLLSGIACVGLLTALILMFLNRGALNKKHPNNI